MLRGLHTATAGMIANQRRHDTITNNIANLNTPGFKANTMVARSFPEMLISLVGGGDGTNAEVRSIGRINTGVLAEEAPMLFTQGDLVQTGNASDFAIVSELQAMFAVRTGDGEEQYTRNGTFTVDAAGQLVTGAGSLVLDRERRPIRLVDETDAPRSIAEVQLLSDGRLIDTVTGNPLLDENGEGISLFVAMIEDPNRLLRVGNGNFALPEGDGLPDAVGPEADVELLQGFVEQSNVDPTQAMVDLMAAQRAYETNQRMVRYYDQSLEKAVNEVGRV